MCEQKKNDVGYWKYKMYTLWLKKKKKRKKSRGYFVENTHANNVKIN